MVRRSVPASSAPRRCLARARAWLRDEHVLAPADSVLRHAIGAARHKASGAADATHGRAPIGADARPSRCADRRRQRPAALAPAPHQRPTRRTRRSGGHEAASGKAGTGSRRPVSWNRRGLGQRQLSADPVPQRASRPGTQDGRAATSPWCASCTRRGANTTRPGRRHVRQSSSTAIGRRGRRITRSSKAPARIREVNQRVVCGTRPLQAPGVADREKTASMTSWSYDASFGRPLTRDRQVTVSDRGGGARAGAVRGRERAAGSAAGGLAPKRRREWAARPASRGSTPRRWRSPRSTRRARRRAARRGRRPGSLRRARARRAKRRAGEGRRRRPVGCSG